MRRFPHGFLYCQLAPFYHGVEVRHDDIIITEGYPLKVFPAEDDERPHSESAIEFVMLFWHPFWLPSE